VVRYLEDDAEIYVLSNDGRSAWTAAAAAERVLFPPPTITAKIHFEGCTAGDYPGIFKLPATLSFTAERSDRGLVIQARDGERIVLELALPPGYDKKVEASLRQAIRARSADDDGGPAKVEAGLYLQSYDRNKSPLELGGNLSFDIMPEYRGRGADGSVVVDKRVLLRLVDPRWGWPFMAKLNVAAANALLLQIAPAEDE
jgi:hypothetical protein